MKYIYQAAVISAMFLLLCGCGEDSRGSEELSDRSIDQPLTVGEIAVDNCNSQGYRICIEENGDLVPFIVLTSNYNGYCLLLREGLLDDIVFYNVPGEYGSYYCGSNVDRFLNEDYYFRLSEKMQRLIVTTEVEITTKNAIDTHADDVETMMRNIFLLSANEVNASLSRLALKEGEPLSYFENNERRIAAFRNLETGPWMLRTPALRDGNTIVGVADNGMVGIGGINTIAGYSDSAVRPAFCIPIETPIMQSDHAENIFVLKN